ncbi:DUF7472 family protein [Halosegnis marinus]|uniref:Transporter n=1 Tax=Halosegnis marinus TaxID=3034023 RepID=A0ABD5ZNT6_9EURY|nr:hypothetical protein [Halosegnis sp. DT85]
MDIERETLVEIAVSTVAVVLFVAALVVVGDSNGASQLTSEGGISIVATILGFVLLMAVVGVFLDRR